MKRTLLLIVMAIGLLAAPAYADKHKGGGKEKHRQEQRDHRNHKSGKNKHVYRKDHGKHDNGLHKGWGKHPGAVSYGRPGVRPTPPPPPPPGHSHGWYVGPDRVYYGGIVINGLLPTAFRLLTDGYGLTSTYVYFNGGLIKGAVPGGFVVLGGGYAVDPHYVYFNGVRMKNVHRKTFRYDRGGYAYDKHHRYFNGRRI
ncbi:MAG: DKNYY domain-containing protein [Muribaculaceae bacterium]|nr:DKNYY domain-containing protein [Muribaculaceae bacterium]